MRLSGSQAIPQLRERHGLQTDRHGVFVNHLTLERGTGCKFLRQGQRQEGKVTIAQIWQWLPAGNGMIKDRGSVGDGARDRHQLFRAEHDIRKLRAVDQDRHGIMRIGQEEMNLSFRQRRDIVLETTPIRPSRERMPPTSSSICFSQCGKNVTVSVQ